MKILLALLAIVVVSSTDASAQNRDFGARRILLDDGLGNVLTLQPSSPLTSGTFTFPNPADVSGTFVMTQSTTGQTITGGLGVDGGFSASAGNASLVVETGGSDRVRIFGRDEAGSDLPLWIVSNNSGLTYGSQTYNRIVRLEQNGTGFYDMGIDPSGNYFITQQNSMDHGLQLSPAGNLWLNGNITLNGTVDGIDVSSADAQNVKLTGNQTVAGNKTLTGTTVLGLTALSQQVFDIPADNSAVPSITASRLRVEGTNLTPSDNTFTLPDGTVDGQILVIYTSMGSNAAQLLDGGNVSLVGGGKDFTAGSTLTLMWSGSVPPFFWLEIARGD